MAVDFWWVALAARLLCRAAMKRRLTGVLVVTACLVAVPARAQARLVPDTVWTTADSVRLGAELTKPGVSGGDMAIGVGVASLLVGLASATAGIALAQKGRWEYLVSLSILAPILTTTLGTVLIIGGASAQPAEFDEARLALERERLALDARRAALLRARVFPAEAEGQCADEAPPPAPVRPPLVPGAAPSTPPLVPAGGHTRRPLRPKAP